MTEYGLLVRMGRDAVASVVHAEVRIADRVGFLRLPANGRDTVSSLPAAVWGVTLDLCHPYSVHGTPLVLSWCCPSGLADLIY